MHHPDHPARCRPLRGLAARLKPAIDWNQQHEELKNIFTQNHEIFGESTAKKYRLIGEFARNTSEMIDYLLDQLQPRDYNRQMAEGFPELCEQILAG